MHSRRPILVIEDDPDTRRAIIRLLEFIGYEAVGREDGRAGLEYLRTGSAALVILDLRMNGMNGIAFLANRDADPDLCRIPVIVYSGQPAESLPTVDTYVSKRGEPDELLAAVRRSLGARSS
jgi:CheY-like chemotaxis protein